MHHQTAKQLEIDVLSCSHTGDEITSCHPGPTVGPERFNIFHYDPTYTCQKLFIFFIFDIYDIFDIQVYTNQYQDGLLTM